jgi:hypothetical protein
VTKRLTVPTAAVEIPRANTLRVCQHTMIAIAPSNATAAATCPDGNDEVGGIASSCATGGRGRSTTKLADFQEQRADQQCHLVPTPPPPDEPGGGDGGECDLDGGLDRAGA